MIYTMSAKKKVLIVEDVSSVMEMFRLALETEGYEIHSRENGIKLIKAIREIEPDIILMDLMMPWIHGLDLCRTIREIPEMREIPIVVVSATDDPQKIDEAYRIGVAEYLVKPVEIQNLLAVVGRLTGDKAGD